VTEAKGKAWPPSGSCDPRRLAWGRLDPRRAVRISSPSVSYSLRNRMCRCGYRVSRSILQSPNLQASGSLQSACSALLMLRLDSVPGTS